MNREQRRATEKNQPVIRTAMSNPFPDAQVPNQMIIRQVNAVFIKKDSDVDEVLRMLASGWQKISEFRVEGTMVVILGTVYPTKVQPAQPGDLDKLKKSAAPKKG